MRFKKGIIILGREIGEGHPAYIITKIFNHYNQGYSKESLEESSQNESQT